MNITREYQYSLSPKELLAVFLDENFIHARYKSAGVNDYQLAAFGKKGNKFVIQIKRSVSFRPTDKIPGLVKKFVREKNHLVTTISWEVAEHVTQRGEFSFLVEGVPGEVKGVTLIKPTAAGSVHQLNLVIKSGIPFVGDKIAALIAEKVVSALEKDYLHTQRYIAEHGRA